MLKCVNRVQKGDIHKSATELKSVPGFSAVADHCIQNMMYHSAKNYLFQLAFFFFHFLMPQKNCTDCAAKCINTGKKHNIASSLSLHCLDGLT